MASKEERDEAESYWEKEQREKEEANRQFTDLIWRHADALEHQSIEMTIGSLAMRGFAADMNELKGIQHRVNCPSCQLIRTAKPIPRPGMPGEIITPASGPLRGIRIPRG